MTRRSAPGMLARVRYTGIGRLMWLGLLLLGCSSGTETGNPSFSAALSYSGHSSSSAIGVGVAGDVASVQSAWFALDAVSISSDGDCGLSTTDSLQVAPLGLGDHGAGAHPFTRFDAHAGSFCSVKLPFVSVAESDQSAPEALRGHSILIEGALADGTPFSIVSDAAPLVQLEAPSVAFQLSQGSADTLLAFDFAVWLAGLDFASAEPQAGRIEISARSNTALLAAFDERLIAGVAFYRDRDGDGVIDSDAQLLAQPR